ncbi:MAG TPA: prolyl oligopeptidase family serine peptidase [Blastocatellia bacterium]|jgi:dipeptidyl aminopeptidase/acylaminoacyl peptidase|nr:prolyl oligopeptidase family serine peptidase [Blastocatellia bacterium]
MFNTNSRHRRQIHLQAPTALLIVCALGLIFANFGPATKAQQASSTRASGQATAKHPLTHQDYDGWRSIQGQSISRNGKFIAYALIPQDGDGEIVVRNLATGVEWRYGRGWRQPTPPPDGDETPGPAALAQAGRLSRVSFTADSRFAAFTIEPNKDDVLKARKEKKAPDAAPKNALGIMDLSNGQVTRVERVKSFQAPEDGPAWIAYQLEAKPEEKKADDKAAEPKPKQDDNGDEDFQRRGRGPGGGRPGGARNEYGSDLVLRNLTTGVERTFADALEYSFSKDAKTLVFTVSSKKEESNGVYAVTPGNDGPPVDLLTGKGKYSKVTWDEGQTQLAFISDRDEAAVKEQAKNSPPARFKLYHWDRKAAKATEIVSSAEGATQGFRAGMVISERGALSFSRDGGELFLGVAPPPEPEKDAEADAADAEDKVSVDLWHWKDDYIQPMQKVRAEQDRNRSYRAVYHIKERKFVQLADATMEGVIPSADGQWAIGSDDREYRILVGRDSNYSDVYLVNTTDGSRKPLLKKFQFPVTFSPGGKYAIFFDGKDWGSISFPDCKFTNLTKSLGVAFWREDTDTPSVPGAYGNGGWTRDDKYALLYDKYDVWQIAPDGSSAKNLTDGVGRKEKIEFRVVRSEQDGGAGGPGRGAGFGGGGADRGSDRGIDPAKPLLLAAENEWTRDSGFYRDRIDGGMPEKLLMAAKNFSAPVKAKDADVLMLTASRFDEYPDILVADPDFKALKKVSDAGKQKDQFTWGKAELVRYKNSDGVPLSGILIKPDDFDPKRKYPMIVYIYERLSDGLHRFVEPRPGTSINASFYASNGYLVLMPDIVYTIGYPGQSALKCVLPAIQSVVDQGFVNEDAIGIQGHSWGGYQIAYMVTQTNRFKAAAPGALVGNMTSAYSGIRWGTGLPRQFQYERTQSRIGGSLWEYPMRFIENSPVFYAQRVQTPILSIHNDNDDAVPWYQGIEFYLALRRLNKEIYMFSYNGEPHGLRRRPNQKDYTRRLQEFFDHFLKGAPAPEWMEKGIPYLQREKEKEKYRTVSDMKEKAQN